VSPVKYELVFYIPDDGILHSLRRENHKSYRPYFNYPQKDVLLLNTQTLKNYRLTLRELDTGTIPNEKKYRIITNYFTN
jgi:hypothetical protein